MRTPGTRRPAERRDTLGETRTNTERAMDKQFIPPPLPTATPFEFFMAKIAGAKLVTRDGDHEITAYAYKGKMYIESVIKVVT
jgi:hypothetical protein